MSFVYSTESRMFITCLSYTRTVYFTLKSFLPCFITCQVFTLSNPLAAEFYLSTPRATAFTTDASNRACITFHLHLVPTRTGMMPKTTTFTLDMMPGRGLYKLTGNIREDERTGEWGHKRRFSLVLNSLPAFLSAVDYAMLNALFVVHKVHPQAKVILCLA